MLHSQLLRPDFAEIVAPKHKEHILQLVRRLIDLFGSSDIAVDDRHTPKLYSRFLDGLVARYSKPQEEAQPRTVPKLEGSPGDAPMSSLPELTMPLSQHSGHITHPPQIQHMGDTQFGQTISPTRYDNNIYTSSNGSGNTVTPYNVEGNIPEVHSEDLLASMQAINNPMWWEHVMMPGFTWPDSVANPSGTSTMGPGDRNQQHQNVDPYSFMPHDTLMQHEHSMN